MSIKSYSHTLCLNCGAVLKAKKNVASRLSEETKSTGETKKSDSLKEEKGVQFSSFNLVDHFTVVVLEVSR